jgi:hypothetical protein
MIIIIMICILILLGVLFIAVSYIWNIKGLEGLELLIFILGATSIIVLGLFSFQHIIGLK